MNKIILINLIIKQFFFFEILFKKILKFTSLNRKNLINS